MLIPELKNGTAATDDKHCRGGAVFLYNKLILTIDNIVNLL